ncbi:probable LRR receptor-like serine/threonine-protein kinase At3g47570 [Nicotiana sylvestris]|uniref:probable LRR receptor-like serine/threonine-protein kinase At3g47570 n=1 Tax=Nicotiana sylvestris TaxID=4096 RepID=UPI00388CCF33
MSKVLYASAVGSLMYVMVCTRPDIAHAVGVVSRYMSNPGKEHWEGFADANLGGDLDSRKSTTGYVFTLGGTAKTPGSKNPSNMLTKVVGVDKLRFEVEIDRSKPIVVCESRQNKRKKNQKEMKIWCKRLHRHSCDLDMVPNTPCVIKSSKRKKKKKNSGQADVSLVKEHERISYYELEQAIEGFGESNLLGNGSFSMVHKGYLRMRLNIMIDVASAMDYLHNGYSTPVVHCDLKPNNVLLDQDMVCHVSDFGIAKLLGAGETFVQTRTIATIGYVAPEYGQDGIVSTSCNVYSFGILMMEAFTRMRPSDKIFTGDLSIRCWVSDSFPSEIHRVVDANLVRPVDEQTAPKMQCMLSIMELALSCTLVTPDARTGIEEAL